MKFSVKLTVFFSAIMLIVGIITSYIYYASNIKLLSEETEGRLEDQAFHTMDKIDRMFLERHAEMINIATDVVISSRSSTPKEITERLTQFRDNHKVYTSISFFDLNRIRIADTSGTNIGKQHPFTGYWQEIVEGKDFALNISESEPLEEVMINFAAIVKDKKGSAFGVVVSRMTTQKLFAITRHPVGIHEAEEGLEIELVDKDGLILYSNYNPEGIFKETSPDWEDIKNDIATGKKIGSAKHIHLGEAEISTFAREQGHFDFKGNDWTLVICIPEKVAFASAIELRNKMIIVFLTASGIAAFLVYLLSHTISKPVGNLTSASAEVAKGNLDVKVEVDSKDEIGQLSESFNEMVMELRKSKNSLLDYSKGLEEKVKERTSELEIELTERKVAEEALSESEERLKFAQSSANVGIWDWYPKIGKLFWSPEIERSYGCTPGTIKTYRDWRERVHPEDIVKVETERDKAIAEHRQFNPEFRILLPGSSMIRWIAAPGKAAYDENGNVVRVSGVNIDITERKRAEDIMQKYRERLSELASQMALSEENKRYYFANILHDFTAQNLVLINFKLSLLAEGVHDDNIKSNIKELQQLTEESIKSVRDLTFELHPPILHELRIEKAVKYLGEQILQKHDIALHFEDDNQTKPLTDEAKTLLYLSLREIIINIVKHAKARNTTISIRRDGDSIQVIVKDDGIGFDAADLDYLIMESKSFGLFSTRERLQEQGGHFEIISQPGQGTTVTMVVPLKK